MARRPIGSTGSVAPIDAEGPPDGQGALRDDVAPAEPPEVHGATPPEAPPAAPAQGPELPGEPGPSERSERRRLARLRRRHQLRKHLGVRSRVTVLFGLGALLLSITMGGISYFSARHFLVGDQETTSVHEALANAESIRSQLLAQLRGGGQAQPGEAVNGIDTPSSQSVLYYGGRPYATELSASTAIPSQLRVLVHQGQPATQNFVIDGDPKMAVGLPIPALHAEFYEVFDLSDLGHTLRVLLLALIAAGVVTTLLGIAVGRLASGRSLRPLSAVSKAAIAIAGGQLATRLSDPEGDPDLAGLTTSFNRMVEQLEERIEREARFTSDVSHELRSPLTTLAASLDVLEAHAGELQPAGQRALVLLAADLRRFQRMVDDLLEISRWDAGSADVALDEVNAAELVHRSVQAGSRLLPAGIAPPSVDTDDIADVHLQVDKRRFERAMTNLLENAALYGGGATRVVGELGPLRPDGQPTIRVAVEDQGPGVAPSERARIFERFYRGQAAGKRGAGTGTGLGLSLVAQHVRLNGGTVWVEQASTGRGARFVIELPMSERSEEEGGDVGGAA